MPASTPSRCLIRLARILVATTTLLPWLPAAVVEARMGGTPAAFARWLASLPLARFQQVPDRAPIRMWGGRVAGLACSIRIEPDAKGAIRRQAMEVAWPEGIDDTVPLGILTRFVVEATAARNGESLNRILLGLRDRIRHGGVRVPWAEVRGARIELELVEQPPGAARDNLSVHAGTLYWRCVLTRLPRLAGQDQP